MRRETNASLTPRLIGDPHLVPLGLAGQWAYFYDDSMFSSGTHYVIKNKDNDDFNISSITASSSYLYAHGDRRTSQRLRTHIQQGHQIVMLVRSRHRTHGCSPLAIIAPLFLMLVLLLSHGCYARVGSTTRAASARSFLGSSA